MGVSDDLDNAADYIEKHGWCKNNLRTGKGNVCARGAIFGGLGLFGNPNIIPWSDHLSRRANDAELALRNCVDEYVPHWNDYTATSKEEVIQAMRDAAIKNRPDEMTREGD